MRSFIILFSQIIVTTALANTADSTDYFGLSFGWQTTKPETSKDIISLLEKKREAYHATLDPDCFYKKEGNLNCGKFLDKEMLAKSESFAAELKEETGGAFDIHAKKEKKEFRDFGGMAQGMVLEEIVRQIKAPWAGNFAGDIFISSGIILSSPPIISDPLLPGVAFAIVEMQSGWMMSSYSPSVGANIRDPDSKTEMKDSEFKKVALFAKPEFNGARLDAWGTAIMAGGQTTLTKLMKNKKYAGQWAFVVFDEKVKPRCSHNLKCQFSDPRNRKVEVIWQ